MARIYGVRERFDPGSIYDTNAVEPGQIVHFFNSVTGDPFKTDLQIAKAFPSDQTFAINGMGARLIGKTRNDEDLLLDHLHVRLVIGDKTQAEMLGPHLSMLRHLYRADEIEQFIRVVDEPMMTPYRPPGYLFLRPFVIPVRQSFHVVVTAAHTLPEAVTMRVHLFGLKTWEAPER